MSTTDPDLDPLISTSDGVPNGRPILNRRDYRISQSDRWGRIRLGVLSVCIFFLIYFCFLLDTWSVQRPQMIVNVPPLDDSLPGPKGE